LTAGLARFEITHSQAVLTLLVIDYSSFLETEFSHVSSIAASSQSFNGLIKMTQFLFAHTFTQIGESFSFIELYGSCEIFQGMEVVFLLKM